MTDQEQLQKILREHKAYTTELEAELLTFIIDLAGEKMLAKERAKVEVYQEVLKQKCIKPQYVRYVYQLMLNAKEHLK